MKRNLFLLPFLVLVSMSVYKPKEDIKQYAATETYPEDTILQHIPIKKAMIVIAHDDDMCAMSGTISHLKKKGWNIAVVSFTKTPERNAAQIAACRAILDTVLFVDLKPEQIRNDREEDRIAYSAFPKDSFNLVFNQAIIEAAYLKQIQAFNPSVIFTLDNDIGGYGHPEHVLISQLVLDLSKKQLIHPSFIYQSVYTNHMENSIMERHSKRMKSWGFPGNDWENAKRIYGVSGMPEPNFQINIQGEAKEKMKYLRSYNERERKTIGFFIPEFENYKAEEYFRIFDREFFRVIRI